MVEILKRHTGQFVRAMAVEAEKQDLEEGTDRVKASADIYTLDNIRLFIGADQEAMLDFLENFLNGLRESVQRIEKALQENDLQTIGYHAHRLFPNVSQLQVPELPALLRQTENAAKSGNSSDALADDVRQALIICRKLETALSDQKESLKAEVN